MMNDLIQHSNYMLFNYGWEIFFFSLSFGVIATLIMYKIENKEEEQKNTDNPLDDNPNFTWDEYGNPEIKD